jgi:hypothetical protein
MSAPTTLRATLAASLLVGTTAQAQLFRAYLSPTGNDANPCTLQAPCRLLPAALNAVANGGEIWMTGSANYNTATVNVTKSVSILAVPGMVGSIVAQDGGPAISIAATNLEVALRNVVIGPVTGAAPGTHGVVMTGDSSLMIENSLVANLPGHGVQVNGQGEVKIAHTTLRNNGLWAVDLSNGAAADISGSQLIENYSGGVRASGITGTTTANLSDSIISGGATSGVRVNASTDATARIVITRSSITRVTGWALDCFGTGSNAIFVGSSLIAQNNSAWDASCGAVYTSSNNQVSFNNGATGTLEPLPLR